MTQAPQFKIRNFGNDIVCHSIAELKNELKAYCGKSVFIECTKKDRLVSVMYIDVTEKG